MWGRGLPLAFLAAVLVVGAVAPPTSGATALLPASGLTPSVSATPSSGSAPLLVQFATSVPSGTPTSYNWSFGDGTYLNGTTNSTSHPSHLYTEPGAFTAEVTVYEGSMSGSATIPIRVVAGPLALQVSANPTDGPAPLTVTFHGSVSGGTGTYLGFNWTFGNGASGTGSLVQYTYAQAGRFFASLTVEDSSGNRTNGGVWVNVSADATPASTALTGSGEVEWAGVGFAAGLGLALLAFPVRSFLTRRGEEDTGSVRAGPEPTLASTDGALAPPERPPALAGPSGPGAPRGSGEALHTSQRLLIHLAGQGTMGPYDVAPVGVTQAGIGAALGVRQNSLTNVLRRLTDAGLIETEVRHVVGQPRRLKVYRLTPRGQILARELRQLPPPRRDE